ncbi:CDP-glycerol glycerophosphotransferase family protein [Vibrio sp. 10N.239.312.D08]
MKKLVIYFGSSKKELYQIDMWSQLLHELSKTFAVEIIFRQPMAYYAYEGPFKKHFCLRASKLESYVLNHDIAACIYVNNTMLNYHMLKYHHFPQLHIGHGESDKSCSSTFHFNAYSKVLVAGHAAKERLLKIGINDANIAVIGRPSTTIDPSPEIDSIRKLAGDRKIIAYTPTWEGGSKETRYSSIDVLGEELIEYYRNQSEYFLVFKPHPLIGKKSKTPKKALKDIKKTISSSNNIAIFEGDINSLFPIVDGLYTDISSVVIDYMQYNKPYVTYVPEWEIEDFEDIQSVNSSQFGHEYNHLMSSLNTLLQKDVNYADVYRFYIENNNLNWVLSQIKAEANIK